LFPVGRIIAIEKTLSGAVQMPYKPIRERMNGRIRNLET
jgi:hypothetical protein